MSKKVRFGLLRVLEFLILIFLIAVGSAFVYLLSQRLDREMDELKTQTVRMLETKLGRRISYQSISPSVFGFLAVRELTIYSLYEPDAVLLRINKVKIYYSIINLLITKDPLSSLSEVHIANSLFHIDQERDRELLDLLNQIYAQRQHRQEAGPSPALRLSGSNITVNFLSGDRGIKLSKLFFKITGRKDSYRLAIRCSIQYNHISEQNKAFQIFSRVKVNGKVDQGFTRSDLAVRIYSLTTENLDIRGQTFQITFNENEVNVRKIKDRLPLDLQFLLNLDTQDVSFKFKTEKYKPSSSFQFTGELKRFNGLLDNSLTSSGIITYNIKEASISYLLDLQAMVKDRRIDSELNVLTHLFGDEKIVYLEPLIVHSQQGSIEFFGNVLLKNFFPAGFLHLIDVRSLTGESLNAAFKVEREPQSLSVRGDRLFIGTTGFDTFDLKIIPGDRVFDFTLDASLADTVTNNSIYASGKLSLDPKPVLELAALCTDISLNALYRLITPTNSFSRDIDHRLTPFSLSLSLDAQTDFKQFDLISPDVRVTDLNNDKNLIRLSFKGNNQGFHVEDLKLYWNDYEMSGLFQASIEGLKTEFTSSLTFEGIPYEFEGFFIPGKEIKLSGTYDFKGSFLYSGRKSLMLDPGSLITLWGSPFQLKTNSFPLPFKQATLFVSTDLNAILTNAGFLFAVSNQTEIKNIPLLELKENSLQFSMAVKKDLINLEKIIYKDSISTIEGRAEFLLSDLTPVSVNGWIKLQDEKNLENYSITADVKKNYIDAEFEFQRAPLERLGELIISGDISGSATVKGEFPRPDVKVSLILNDGRLNVDPVALELSIGYTENRITLESMNLAYLSHKIINGQGRMDIASGEFNYGSGYRADYFGHPVKLNIDLRGNMESPEQMPGIKNLLHSNLEGLLRFWDIRVQNQGYSDWIVHLKAQNGILSIDGGPNNTIHGQFSEEEEFTLNLLEPLPVQGFAKGKIEGDRIESTFDITWMDIRIINTLTARTDIFNFTQGFAEGGLRITGLISDPDFYGALEVSDAILIFDPCPDEVGPINGQLVFNEKSFTMLRSSTFAGKAEVESEGIFYLDHWIPTAYELQFQIESYPGIWVRYNFGTVFADGYANGAVRLLGDRNSVRVEGDLLINSCRIALEKKEAEESEGIPLVVKMNLRTGPRVEFYWPSMVFPIIHTYAKQGEQVLVVVDGVNQVFAMSGDVEIRGGEIFYFDRSFYLKQGSIIFEETVDDFDPRIKALAEIRERDQNNEDIRIYLETDNKLSQFSPRFYSDPSLPDMMIMDYIGGSIFNRIEETGLGISAVLLTSDVVSRFVILAPFERAVREILGLDLFSIRTQFVQNILIGKLLGEKITSNVFNPLDNTTLSLGKYLGTDLFLEMLVRFQAVDVISGGYVTESQIQTEGEINFEWTTPFFLLEWSFTPQHPENLFLTDNSIGLKWKFSY